MLCLYCNSSALFATDVGMKGFVVHRNYNFFFSSKINSKTIIIIIIKPYFV